MGLFIYGNIYILSYVRFLLKRKGIHKQFYSLLSLLFSSDILFAINFTSISIVMHFIVILLSLLLLLFEISLIHYFCSKFARFYSNFTFLLDFVFLVSLKPLYLIFQDFNINGCEKILK